MKYANLVQSTSTTVGTGNITVSGTPAARRFPFSGLTVGKQYTIAIAGQDASTEIEESVCTILSGTTFSRDTVLKSSNGDALVNFSAGTKDVYVTASAEELNKMPTVDDIAFATTIPLTALGSRYMPLQTISAPMAFTLASNPVRGAYVHMHLLSDDTNEPTFADDIRKSGTSMDWDLRTNVLHDVWVWHDGLYTWRHIMTDADGEAEPVPATAVTMTGPTSVVVNVASSNYTVGTDGTRAGSVVVTPTPVTNVTFTPTSVTLPAGTSTGTFTATSTTTGAKTIAVTNDGGLTNPSNITLTVNASATAPGAPTIGTATAGDASLSITFTAPGSDGGSAITGYIASAYKVSDDTLVTTGSGSASPISITGLTNGTAVYVKVAAINAVGTGSQSAASNSVTPAASGAVFRFASLSGMTESGTSPDYVYTSTSSSFSGCSSVGNLHRATGTDGSLAITHPVLGSNNATLLGLKTTAATGQSYTDTKYAFYAAEDGSFYRHITNGGSVTNSSVEHQANDIMRLRVASTSVVAEIARTATPTTFIEVHTWTGDDGSALYFLLQLVNGGAVTNYIDNCTAVDLV